MKELRVIPENHTPTIRVSNTAEVEVAADRAVLDIEVSVNIREQKSAFSKTTNVDKVRAVLGTIQHLRASGETIEKFANYKDKTKTEWKCSYIVEGLDEPQVQQELQEVLSRLVGIEGCCITGPQWQLSSKKQAEAHTAAQKMALENAMENANELAQLLDCRIDRVIQVDSSETAINAEMTAMPVAATFQEGKSRSLPGKALDINVAPACITTTGSITLILALTAR
ncbi:SIMPL domain-containing protein [Corynebacterium freiburgense]|uniref:SIMPL domain-containing protein n=1 Tax=Corynebacterium freiburgense TaxID=556548 RepID=UPI00040B66C5|nr:SIMPL domain-containing protein [Corynebacterium freiburgense]WJZ02884.1 oxidative stress defense protein [Corynebacterium freiburgense]